MLHYLPFLKENISLATSLFYFSVKGHPIVPGFPNFLPDFSFKDLHPLPAFSLKQKFITLPCLHYNIIT
jgi:hypothetical protein